MCCAAAANCCLLPEMPLLGGLVWGLFIVGSRVAAVMALNCRVGGADISLQRGLGALCLLLTALGAGHA